MANTPTNGDDDLFGSPFQDTIDGLGGNDFIQGGGGGDTLIGNNGNDALWSGGGNALLIGGAGNDTYLINQAASAGADLAGIRDETVSENGVGGGTDQLLSYCTIFMTDADLVNVENVRLVSKRTWVDATDGVFTGAFKTLAVDAVGNALDNIMEGTGAAHCTLTGGTGNDTYIVHDIPGGAFSDILVENLGEGNDTVKYTPTVASQTFSLATLANIENLTFGGTLAVNGVGNTLDNTLTGNAGTNTLTGGTGNDYYVVQTTVDKFIENAGEGTDTVECPFTITLATLPNIENVVLAGTLNVNATGNTSANTLVGNTGNNILDGGTGTADIDNFFGGGGNDTYLINNTTDTVLDTYTYRDTTVAALDGGTDLIQATLTNGQLYDMHLWATKCENLTLMGTANSSVRGNDQNNTLTGNSGNNTIDGQDGGNDMLFGGAGNDYLIASQNGGASTIDGGTGADTMVNGNGTQFYVVDNPGDIIIPGAVIGGFHGINAYVSFNMNTNAVGTGEREITLEGSTNINATGNDLSDSLVGNTGANIITGGTGNDTILGGGGADKIFGMDGNDTVTGGAMGCTLDGGNGDDTVSGAGGSDLIIGGAGNDTLVSNGGSDLIQGGAGNDLYIIVDALAKIDEVVAGSGGIDTVKASLSYSLVNIANVENLTLTGGIIGTGNTLDNVITGTGGNNTLQGLSGTDTLIGGGGNDTLDGGTGADTMTGGPGNDIFIVDNPGDMCTGGGLPGVDTIMSSITFDLNNAVGVRNLTLTGTSVINGFGDLNDNALTGNAAFNSLAGGDGNDTYIMNNTTDVILEAVGKGTDLVISTVNFNLSSALYNAQEIENLTLSGTSATLGTGNGLDNIITSVGSPTFVNTLDGGAGNDTFVIDPTDVILTDASGNDTVQVAGTYSIALRPDLENIWLSGTGNFSATGNASVNILAGNNVGNNILDAGTSGGAGDTYVGSSGNDTYMADEAADTVVEDLSRVGPDTGTDLVIASVDYDMLAMATKVENLTLTGTALVGKGNTFNNVLTGNAFDNTLTGDAGNDTFHGGGGTDTMIGNVGNDTYFVDVSSDIITEAAGALEGTADAVLANVNYDMSLNATGEVEILTLTLTGTALVGVGNASNNTITGNTGANTLDGGVGNDTIDGGAGADTMIGGTGNDTFIVDNTLDVVTEAASGGTADLIKTSLNYTLHSSTISEVENLTLTGSANVTGTGNDLVNTITGNGGANVLDGQLGADTMIGNGGADTYIVDNALDTVIGSGLVMASVNYDMGVHATGASSLTLTGTATQGIGNTLNNIITTNILVDTLTGGSGNDTFFLLNANDVVTDADAGTESDLIMIDTSKIGGATSYNMLTNATGTRALTITGGGNFDITCNNLPGGGPAPLPMGDTITGNSGINHIMGGTGDDTFFVGTNDFVLGSGGGSDTVGITFSLSLLSDEALGVNAHWKGVEDILLTGTAALNATGDLAVNTLTGNSGINLLDDGGYSGAAFAGDTMIGGAGNDTYFVNNSADIVDEVKNGGGGVDWIFSTVSYTLGDGVDNAKFVGSGTGGGTFIGNGLNNTLIGTSFDDYLDGAGGADVMNGGLGNDTYVVDSTDTIMDTGGIDTVISEKGTYTLPTGMENLTLEPGFIATVGIGNTVANVIIGNALNNTLDGAAGADTMFGGDGNDTFMVDNVGDVVKEDPDSSTLPGAGLHDTIISTVSYTLGDALAPGNHNQVEDLTLSGTALRGFGNQLDNHIIGNASANTLAGNSGSDWLVGGSGNDILYAENATGQPASPDAGTDVNTLDGGLGKDTLFCGNGIDTVVCNTDATTNVDIVNNFQQSGGDHVLFTNALIGFDPLQNSLDDFIAHRQVSANVEWVYIDRDGSGTAYHFQLALILNEIP